MSGRLIRSRFVLTLAAATAASILAIGCAQTTSSTPTAAPKAAAPASGAATTAPAAAQPAGGAAPTEIKIGLIYPLTGSAAGAGVDSKNGPELASEIVNGNFNLPMPGGKGGGLPNLGNAKIKLVIVDSQGVPEKGSSEAERLITQEKVVALVGSYHSSVTQTASQMADRLGIPFVNGESSSPALTDKGLKTFFRTGPHDITYGEGLFDMLDYLKKEKGAKIETIATVNENTLAGTDASAISKRLAEARGYKVVQEIAYPGNTTEVTSEVQRLKSSNPDAVFQLSYTADAVLFMKTWRQLDFNPQGILTFGSGFVDPEFTKLAGKDAEYVITRAAWSPDIAQKSVLAKQVKDMYEAKYKQQMTENSGRSFTAMVTLLDAINRAKSTDPQAIVAALKATDIPGDQLIMPWKGVKFDEKGQNTLAQTINMQMFGSQYYTVYPTNVAAKELVWPRPKWSEIK